MKTIEIQIYQYNELSEEAKENARSWYMGNGHEHCDYIFEEAYASLKEFINLFSIDYRNFDLLEMHRSIWSVNLDDNIKNLSGQRLATYIWNNYKGVIYSRKYFSFGGNEGTKEKPTFHPMRKARQVTNKCPNDGLWFSYYYSRIQIVESCPFTGVCYDDDLLTPIWDFMRKPDDRDFKELLRDCIYSLAESVQSEVEYQSSEEAIQDAMEANQYEFTEDGERY